MLKIAPVTVPCKLQSAFQVPFVLFLWSGRKENMGLNSRAVCHPLLLQPLSLL